MPTVDAIRWFKSHFHHRIDAAVAGTPFTVDMLTAIACQETGHIWNILRNKMTTAEVLALCVGDTLDASKGRKAFPKTKADLLAKPNGQQMFDIARKALVDMSQFIPGFKGAVSNPNKFCHGFGIFQYDLQFFLEDPDYFLQQRYADFEASLAKALEELKSNQKKLGLSGRTTLTELEMVAIAIAYNTGSFTPSKGLKQGHFDGRRHYGEAVFDFLRLSKTVSVDGAVPALLPAPGPGLAPVLPPTPVTAAGPFFEVDVRATMLNVRRDPIIPAEATASNVIAKLPDGHVVRSTGRRRNNFVEVETSLSGALIRGFVDARFLKPAPTVTGIPVAVPAPESPTTGITAVFMPRKPGSVTRRKAAANAHSLNETKQPTRQGETAEERRAELAAIIEWLAVDDESHQRYQPTPGGATFCSVYAHDYCHLAGCYVPRVWWSPAAIEAHAQGQAVLPRLGSTIDEQRANDIFYWLRDFGGRFGWRRTGTPTKLQTEVNQGAVGLIVARADGFSGRIVVVAPETDDESARRNTAGDVIAPLQSQAGTTNFRYGTGRVDWWMNPKFAESAFWLHA